MVETLVEMNRPVRGKLYSFFIYCCIDDFNFNTVSLSHYLDGLFGSKWCFR